MNVRSLSGLSTTKPPVASPDTQTVAQLSEVFPDELNTIIMPWNHGIEGGKETISFLSLIKVLQQRVRYSSSYTTILHV